MNEINIDEFLRNNKPVVKDDPAFLLKVRQRLDAVEGIKDEVDRQRRLRHIALRVTLLIGIVAGCLISAFILLVPLDSIRDFIGEWKLYIAVAVSIVFTLICISTGDNLLLKINKLRPLLPLKNAEANRSTN